MKRFLLYSLCSTLILSGCNKDPDAQAEVDNRKLFLYLDKTNITANGIETVAFSVKLGDEDVTTAAKLKMNNADFSGSTFTSTEPGTYRFSAVHEGKTSNQVTVTVTKVVVPVPILSADKTTIFADGEAAVTFTVRFDGEDVTSAATIFEGETKLAGNTFATTEPGTYKFTTEYDDKTGNEITVIANELPVNVLSKIPDPAFLEFCQSQMDGWDANRDGILSLSEAAAVRNINISGWRYNELTQSFKVGKIISLVGIEYFTGLISIGCSAHQLTVVDLSKNIALEYVDISFNKLTEINLRGCATLKNLSLTENRLSTVDVTTNISLENLYLDHNPISSINVSNNTKLTWFGFSYSQLASLDLSKNTALETLIGSGLFESIDLSGNPKLVHVNCSGSRLRSMNISQNPELTHLHCTFGDLRELDISNNLKLTTLWCWDNSGDGETFPIKAWFDNESIPEGVDFTTSAWSKYGRTVTPVYYTGDISPGVDQPMNNYYTSTDYSADGRVMQLQKATEGNGIDIVLMGDGYSDRLIADGTYERTMRQAMDYFFTEEPYKSFRLMFNVWMVDVVSKHEVYDYGSVTALNSLGATGNNQGCISYALRAVPANALDDAVLIVIANDTSNLQAFCTLFTPNPANDYASGLSISHFAIGPNEDRFRQVLLHEANGHGFAKLADEYWTDDNEAVDESQYPYIKGEQAATGFFKNIDVTNDPTLVSWAKFLSDPRYAGHGLGVFEGGRYVARGIWRSTENSIMRFNTGGFNTPSREAIYYRIHKLAYGAGWQYNHEDFIAWDLAHYNSPSAVTVRAAAARTAGIGVLKPTPHTPPVIIPHSWREEFKK